MNVEGSKYMDLKETHPQINILQDFYLFFFFRSKKELCLAAGWIGSFF